MDIEAGLGVETGFQVLSSGLSLEPPVGALYTNPEAGSTVTAPLLCAFYMAWATVEKGGVGDLGVLHLARAA